jgi:hypothetical protein
LDGKPLDAKPLSERRDGSKGVDFIPPMRENTHVSFSQ